MGEVFFIQPVMKNNLSHILKIHHHLAEITLGNRLVRMAKKTVLIFWEGSFGGVKWYIRPPWSGKW
jgi:hypothetical protein